MRCWARPVCWSCPAACRSATLCCRLRFYLGQPIQTEWARTVRGPGRCWLRGSGRVWLRGPGRCDFVDLDGVGGAAVINTRLAEAERRRTAVGPGRLAPRGDNRHGQVVLVQENAADTGLAYASPGWSSIDAPRFGPFGLSSASLERRLCAPAFGVNRTRPCAPAFRLPARRSSSFGYGVHGV